MAQTLFTEADVRSEGRQLKVSFTKTTTGTGVVEWTIDEDLRLYDGALVLLKTSEFNQNDIPTNGNRYEASQDITFPADTIGEAIVVGAFYGDKITNSVDITGLDQESVYFVSVHLVTNVLQYYKHGRLSYASEQKTEAFTGEIPSSSAPPTNPEIGQVYYNTQTGKVSMWTGAVWINASTGTTKTGHEFPTTGLEPGQFFYHTTTKKLFCWDGTEFKQANTKDEGKPLYERLPGDDGSSDERNELISKVKRALGWPVICVELNEEHFSQAIDSALAEFRRRVDTAYDVKYFLLPMKKGQDVYYLNDPAVGTNAVVDVVKLHRVSGLGLVTQNEGIYAQSYLQQMHAPGGIVDLTSIYLMSAYSEQFSQIFAGDIGFKWHESSRQLTLYRRIFKDEKILIECTCERTEQELMVDRYSSRWLYDWAVAESKKYLGHIRSKYGSLPGAGGGLSLNGQDLLLSAREEQEELIRQINDFEVGNGGSIGNHSFLMG